MELKQGKLLQGGAYRIEQVLGQGSFGITYLATHTALDKKVAIKEFFMKELNGRGDDGSITGMSDGSLSMNYARKFQKEALNLSRLEHPNIVRVTDSFEDNGTFYYVMDYIEGENLNDYVKHHNVSQQEAVDIISDVAKALMYMHEEKHMLHLDLKPGNIMRRSSDGHIFLIDFGLSKHYSSNGQPKTSTTIGLGTPGYAPIEQANQAKSGEFRPTIDVYALGATFYKLLTRETPSAASELVSDEELLAKSLKQHNINSKLSNVVVNAMLPSVRMRTQSVKDFLASLDSKKKDATINTPTSSKRNATNTTSDETIAPSTNDEETVIRKHPKGDSETQIKSSSNANEQNNNDTEDVFEEKEGIFSFDGRIGRLEYLLSLIAFSLAWIGILSVCSAVFVEQHLLFWGICVSIVYYWIIFAQGAKRCHDIGRSGWFQLIPFYGLAMLFCKGEKNNDYGKAHGVGAIKHGKILAAAFIVGLFAFAYSNGGTKHYLGEINDTIQYDTNHISIQKQAQAQFISDMKFSDLGLSVKWAWCDLPSTYTWDSIPNFGKYRLPTKAEFEELINKCKWEYGDGVGGTGYWVYGKNKEWIFFPAKEATSDNFESGSIGFYWSSTPCREYPDNAWELELTDRQINLGWWYCTTRRSIRLVCDK